MNSKYFNIKDRQHEADEERADYLNMRKEVDVDDFLQGLEVETIDADEAIIKLTEKEGLHELVLAAIAGIPGPLERAYGEIAGDLWKQEIVEKEMDD